MKNKSIDEKIKVLRKTIDGIDESILDLINQRLLFGKNIGEIKKKSGSEILDIAREKEILDRLAKKNSGPLSNDVIFHVFKIIMAASRDIQTEYPVYESMNNHIDGLGCLDYSRQFFDEKSTFDIFGVMGNPVVHSLSPFMHNFAFNFFSLNSVYTRFEPLNLKYAVSGIRELGIKGVSVTIPYKESIIKYLDTVSESAEKIGAVNTIVNRNGFLEGHNTDWKGFVRALEKHTKIKDKNILLIGAGGAARGIAYGINIKEGQLFITNRTDEKGRVLAKEFSGEFVNIHELGKLEPEIIVNATSVGMYPYTEVSPVDESVFKSGGLAFDIVYNPVETRFLQLAKKKGFKTVSGISMFVYQGEEQFKIWTGKEFPAQLLKEKIFEKIYNI
ncbi:MAG: shikimate dehydrogenase [Deltaproteobacteria bacterium]|nr:MAG: shikimate dehydrogenase [Deltaproteobacteria bacterium]